MAAFITHTAGDLSTIMLKRTPFTPAEVDRFKAAAPTLPDGHHVVRARAAARRPASCRQLASRRRDAEAAAIAATYPRQTSAPVTDDSPFFWHFVAASAT